MPMPYVRATDHPDALKNMPTGELETLLYNNTCGNHWSDMPLFTAVETLKNTLTNKRDVDYVNKMSASILMGIGNYKSRF